MGGGGEGEGGGGEGDIGMMQLESSGNSHGTPEASM